MGWLLTELPEPRPRRQGLHETFAQPAEYAAAAAFMKEQTTLEQATSKKSPKEDEGRGVWASRRQLP